jgi:pyrroline-5-carboxylate reductase
VDVRPRLGVLGGGRLAEGLAKTWLARTGRAPLIWSRSGPSARVPEATWVNRWTGTLEAGSVVIAIPGRAVLELAQGNEQARQFRGNVFSATASLSHASLRRVFPNATVICIAPFLIDGVNSIPMVALKPMDVSDPDWTTAKAMLDDFGDCDVVHCETAFAQLSLLGASWPAVVLAAVHAAAGAGVERLPADASRLGRRIFFRALHALLATCARDSEHASPNEIATPGGITERGLKSSGDMTSHFDSVFKQMQSRAEELRA